MLLDCGNVGIAGYYTFELNGVPVFEAPSRNIITDFGWNRLMNLTKTAVGGLQIQLGTSNTPPTAADTALGALLAVKTGALANVATSGTDANGAYNAQKFSFAYTQGAVVGNVAEVGFKVGSGDASLTSRSLIKDGLGNPAVIVVTAIDQLTVNYELRFYRAALDLTGSVTVAGVPTTYILRTAAPSTTGAAVLSGLNPMSSGVGHYGTGTTFGAPGVGIGGLGEGGGTGALVSKVVNTGTNTVTFTTHTVGTSIGNTSGGVVNMSLQLLADGDGNHVAYGDIKVNFTPAVPKTGTKTVNYSFSFTFTRL